MTSGLIVDTYEAGVSFNELSQLYDNDLSKFKTLVYANHLTDMTYIQCSQLYDADKQKFQHILFVVFKSGM
ncbi:hypothetical protein [Candidatus Aquarickettsia rohweri]|uniref:Uncharacterized protein n=1 Tax=Candidatus Aquarickettsia rohweri TaxID=2602574 RepID=A0A429XST6_9RICK|nr:hypothetical protein [Candidatus Aquarickettsia rohweri]RST70247.1 hypothetical protein EIC27_01760 [Candidatus Aquarickettsia rohweri]